MDDPIAALLKRRRPAVAPEEPAAASPSAAPQQQQQDAAEAPVPDPVRPKIVRTPRPRSRPTTRSRSREDQGTRQSQPRKASTVWIPERLLSAVIAYRERTNRSNGVVVLASLRGVDGDAIRARLAATTGGGGIGDFAVWGRTDPGPYKAWNIRMRLEDYEFLDGLVEELGAASRGQLLTTALDLFLAGETADA